MKFDATFRRGLKPADIEAIRLITKSTGFFEAVEGEIDCAVHDAADSLENGEEASGSAYVMMDVEGAPAGYVSFGPVEMCEGTFFLYWIVVHQKYRGCGLGKILMRRGLEEVFKGGARKAFLQTSARPQYEPTRQFYLKCGLKLEAVLKDYYQRGEDCCYYSISKEEFEALK